MVSRNEVAWIASEGVRTRQENVVRKIRLTGENMVGMSGARKRGDCRRECERALTTTQSPPYCSVHLCTALLVALTLVVEYNGTV